MVLYTILFSFVLYTCVLTGIDSSLVKSSMEESRIVPDVIDTAPTGILQVTYPNGIKVELGNELTPTEVKDQPILQWDADVNGLYTVLMTDPDAAAEFREVRHWLVVNIPGNKISEGKSVVDYVGSGPSLGTGLHRYIFLVFKQPSVIKTDVYISNTTREGRTQTKARDLIKEYNLGIPVAGNFYRAQYDDYVPILHARYM